MQNHWNLDLLFHSEEEWQAAVGGLPSCVLHIKESLRELEVLSGNAPEGIDSNPGLWKEEIRRSIGRTMNLLEDMIRRSAYAEIWLSRKIALEPLEAHYAELSDYLDQMELGELPLMRELQRVFRRVDSLEMLMTEDPDLRPLYPYCRHLCQRIIPLETLSQEKGDGWYRLQTLMADATVDYQEEDVTFRELQAENGFSEWGEAMHPCLYELYELFYAKYGQAAADILCGGLILDEEDYRQAGADSLTVYLRDYGLSPETLDAILQAVEEALPELHACKRVMDRWHEEAYARTESDDDEDCASGEEYSDETGGLQTQSCIDTEDQESCGEDSDEDMNARNAAAFRTLRQTLLDQFAGFHPEFNAMLEEAFDGGWIWINDDPLAYMNQHASMIPGTGLSYIFLAADCYLQAAAHELGHAWYNRLLRNQNILYNANELLLEVPSNLAALWSHYQVMEARDRMLDEMELQGADPSYVEDCRRFLDSPLRYEEVFAETAANIFDGWVSFSFERELRSRILKESLSAEDITQMYLKYRRQMLLPENQDWKLDPMRWVELHSLYTCRSYYNLPYIISMILAHRLMQDYEKCANDADRSEYWRGIGDFIREMNLRPMEEVLSEHFREDIRSADFWRDTIVMVLRRFSMQDI